MLDPPARPNQRKDAKTQSPPTRILPTDPSTRSLRSLGRDDSMKRRSAPSVWTNGRYREEDVIPSGVEGGVEESVGKMGGCSSRPLDLWTFRLF